MSPIVHNKVDPKPRGRQAEEDTNTPAVILSEDGDRVVGVCDGPLPDGRCPWADSRGKLPCEGAWLIAAGFPFKVAEDARACPVAALGLATLEKW